MQTGHAHVRDTLDAVAHDFGGQGGLFGNRDIACPGGHNGDLAGAKVFCIAHHANNLCRFVPLGPPDYACVFESCLDVLDECHLLDYANRSAESLGLLHRKRLELARALATDPLVLFLDEIGAGLTDDEAAELVETIKQVHAHGIAIVWIEHIVHVLVQVVGRLVCMDAGRVIADGEPDVVMADAAVIDAYLGGSGA